MQQEQQDSAILQRTENWKRLRLGKFTSGHAYIFMANSKVHGEPNATVKTFITQKLWELVTGHAKDLKTWQMEHGNTWEPFAKKMVQDRYKSEYFDELFIQNPLLPYHGGSPDGSILINGMDTTAEIKCPVGEEQLANIKHFRSEEALKIGYPELYWQCQSNMYLQKTKIALPVTFNHEGQELMYKDMFLSRNDEDINKMFVKMAEGWEWMKKEAELYNIDILAKYAEYAKPLVNGMPPIDINEATRHLTNAA